MRALGDVSADDFRRGLGDVAGWVTAYRETLESRAISPAAPAGSVAAQLTAAPPEEGEPLDRILADLDAVVMPGIVHWGHPAFLGYFGSTSNGPALLGEIVAATLNVSAMTWRTSPAATELETVVLSWIRGMIGLPEAFTGVVYDTASVALLHALVAAREERGAQIRTRGTAGRTDLPPWRIYASVQAHSSVEKCAIVLGVGETNVVRVPVNRGFQMDTEALGHAMDADRRAGTRPLAVVATVGTTSTASVDPVAEIAAIAAAHGAWLHVDAAYGGAIGLLAERRHLLEGIDLADSVVVNPHKWMFVPLDFSALYVRRPEALRAVFRLTPEYLEGDSSARPEGGGDEGRPPAAIDYMDYGIQLGRRFRALKAWMVFRAFGRSGLESRIREHCRLAALFARWVEAESGFHLAAPVVMSVVCFRYEPPGSTAAEANARNAEIVESVNRTGQAYLTRTRLDGRTVMRIGLGNLRTEERHVALAWELVRRAAVPAVAAGQGPAARG